jgi:predicted AAA+ superfamily ATPase
MLMKTNLQQFRFLGERLNRYSSPRLVIITGARQTGKTTLAKTIYPHLNYINLDSSEFREAVRSVRTDSWADAIGPAVLDEAQKEPAVFDKVKYAFDAGEISETVLLGSSQILMLQKVRETLAGRAFIYEMWPLMTSEIGHTVGEPAPNPPLLDRLLAETARADSLFQAIPNVMIGDSARRAADVVDHLLQWGGMPALLPLPEEERRKWLQSYEVAYLERDLGDMARLNDLMPFRQFQRLCALRTGQLLSYSELGRDGGVSVSTSRSYLQYLNLSYQAFLLPPYSTNLTSSVIKSPKVYWSDIGIWRQQTHYHGPVTGQIFETFVVSEIYKWLKTTERDVEINFYRTRSGLEVDLLLTTPHGVWGMEAKAGRKLAPADWRGLREVGRALGDRWLGGLVIYRGTTIEQLDENIWAIPAERLLA